jgi:hypothetical protein
VIALEAALNVIVNSSSWLAGVGPHGFLIAAILLLSRRHLRKSRSDTQLLRH